MNKWENSSNENKYFVLTILKFFGWKALLIETEDSIDRKTITTEAYILKTDPWEPLWESLSLKFKKSINKNESLKDTVAHDDIYLFMI